LHRRFSKWYCYGFVGYGSARSPPGGQGGGHPALRESAGNAVMTLRGIRTEHGLEGGELEALLGDRSALDHLFSVTYEELRRLASSVRRSDPNASLSPTTLVNEAWLKLRSSPGLANISRLHFKRIAARAMRQVLIEAARRRKAHKRGGGGLTIVTLGEAVDQTPAGADELLGLLEEDARGESLLDRDVANVAGQVLEQGIPPALLDQDFGPYRMQRMLGEGGMGVVYLAERADLGSVAAIKILRDAWLSPD